MSKINEQLQKLQQLADQYKGLQDASMKAAQEAISVASKNATSKDIPHIQSVQLLLSKIGKMPPKKSLKEIGKLTQRITKAYK